jgi:hypothetical protein
MESSVIMLCSADKSCCGESPEVQKLVHLSFKNLHELLKPLVCVGVNFQELVGSSIYLK